LFHHPVERKQQRRNRFKRLIKIKGLLESFRKALHMQDAFAGVSCDFPQPSCFRPQAFQGGLPWQTQ
jgi:hypothetical protein